LRHAQIQPGLLDFLANGIVGHGLNGGNLAPGGRDRCDTGPYRDSVQVNGAGAALSNTAPKFGAFHADNIPNGPKQRHVVRHVQRVLLPVYGQVNHWFLPL
jgi:hypothetical protein